jgi:hypothetical protein
LVDDLTYRATVAGETYQVFPLFGDSGLTSLTNQIVAEDPSLPIFRFLYLSLTNFAEAKGEFQSLTSTVSAEVTPRAEPANTALNSAGSRATTDLPSDPSMAGRAVMEKLVDGLGPRTTLASVKAVRYEYKGLSESLAWDELFEFPSRYCVEGENKTGAWRAVAQPAGGFTYIWESHDPTKKKGMVPWKLDASEKLLVHEQSTDLFYIAQHVDDPTFLFRVIGREDVEGVETIVLMIDTEAWTARWNIALNYRRILRISYEKGPDKGSTLSLRDWRIVHGLSVPFIFSWTGNGKTLVSELLGLEINPELDPALFALDVKKPPPLPSFAHNLVANAMDAEKLAATLQINTVPHGAQIFMNDEMRGSSSLSDGISDLINLKPGTYSLRVSAPGFKTWVKTVDINAGEDVRLQASLEPAGPPPFAVGDITELLKGGVSPKRVATLVQQRGVSFVLDDDSERRIRDAGGDTDLLWVIAKAKK